MRSGLFGRAGAGAGQVAAEAHFNRERPCMAGAGFADKLIHGFRKVAIAREALEFGAVVVRRTCACHRAQFVLIGDGIGHDDGARRFDTAIEKDGSQNGFEGVHEEALLRSAACGFLAATQVEKATKIQTMGRGEQVGGAHKVVLQEGKLPFAEILKLLEQPFTDKPAENGIAEEFEALVIEGESPRVCLVRARTVGEGANKESTVFELMVESLLEVVEIVH